MQIYVDADACPVVGIVEELAIKYKIPVRCYVTRITFYILITVE